ncbi:2'-hydroxyisoflavone reductase [Fusarium subglutinans]|uniref:2'-hydroxyisoflavone reductase n=1 Tax=Gibberella subglutinans TaxID=42677 RepID=A0A8H5P350_GIBSU|nr:2'-hydroxyisoflavone reductase [Fusarium subglutinans]KAF5588024.1 2'-hydroxyisoflavone reductase [Fusarium subglutinans]
MSLVRKVAVIGASGNVGKSAVKALLQEGFQVTGLTRKSSNSTLPQGIDTVRTDYSEESLVEVLKGHDAVVSTASGIAIGQILPFQKLMVDATIKAGVKVFVPSEFGVDTASPEAPKVIPFVQDKIDTLDYIKTKNGELSWIAIVSGAMFDWGLNIPGFGGFNIPARTATLYDGGDIAYEATNLDQVGRAIAKSLKNLEITRNQHVYVNSFTVTQNDVLSALEKVTGDKFQVSHGTVDELWEGGTEQVINGNSMGALAQISGAIYGKGGVANYSIDKGLWNDKIGLPGENLEEFVKGYMKST